MIHRFREYVDTLMAPDSETHVQTSSYKPHSERVHFALKNANACASVLAIKVRLPLFPRLIIS